MLVSSKKLLDKAKKEGYAVGAFNTSTLEVIKAVIEAACEKNSPVIIETSEGEIKFMEPKVVSSIVKTIAKEAKIPVALHLDHGQSLEMVKKAIEAGYTSVHIDGSSLSFEENIKVTKEVVNCAHKKNIAVEGELGHILGHSEKHHGKIDADKLDLTDPNQAEEFVRKTRIDFLAPSVGNSHGIYMDEPKLDFNRLKKISEIGIPISLHGGSGIPKGQIEKAISLGVAKINVNTELRIAYSDGLREELSEKPTEVVPYKFLPEVIDKVKNVVKGKIEMFGSNDRIDPK